jgi:hypothetical protein
VEKVRVFDVNAEENFATSKRVELFLKREKT